MGVSKYGNITPAVVCCGVHGVHVWEEGVEGSGRMSCFFSFITWRGVGEGI